MLSFLLANKTVASNKIIDYSNSNCNTSYQKTGVPLKRGLRAPWGLLKCGMLYIKINPTSTGVTVSPISPLSPIEEKKSPLSYIGGQNQPNLLYFIQREWTHIALRMHLCHLPPPKKIVYAPRKIFLYLTVLLQIGLYFKANLSQIWLYFGYLRGV